MVTCRELFEKVIFTEAAYKVRSDKSLKDKGKALQPYRNYRDETRIFVIACVIMVAIQTAAPSFKTKKTMPGCIRSFSGYPLAGGVEDMSGLQYIACVLEKMRNSDTEPWGAIYKYKSEVLVKRMKEILENYILKRSDIQELYTKKREFMILNPELVAPEEHKITKWMSFLPPVIPYTIIKNIHHVSSDFESHLKELMRKGSDKQDESIAVLKSKILYYGYGIIECINVIVKNKDLVLKNTARIPFLENACCNETLTGVNPLFYFNEEDKTISHFGQAAKKLAGILDDVKRLSKGMMFYHPTFTGVRYSNITANNLNDLELIYSAIIHYCNFDKDRPIPDNLKVVCNEKPEKYNRLWTIYEKIEFMKKEAHQYNVDHLQQLMRIINEKNMVSIDKPVLFTKIDVMKDVLEKLDRNDSILISEPLRRLLFQLFDSYKPKSMSYDVSEQLYDLKNYLITTNRSIYRQIIDFFARYGNLTDINYQHLHTFLSQIEKWKIDKNMKERGLYYDEGLYAVCQFVQNSIQALSKIYPSILINEVGFYKMVPKHWGFSERHKDIIVKFIQDYYGNIENFMGDKILLKLLQEIDVRLTDLNLFVQNIPVYTDMVKDMGDDVEGERVRTFYNVFDKETTYLLHSYCFYSVIYEYINCANEVDLLRADVEEIKSMNRKKIAANKNKSNRIHGLEITSSDTSDLAMDMNEVDIVTGNLDELKKRVAALLISFLEVEEENKSSIDYSYEEIMQKVRRDKDIEKQGIIEGLGKLSIEERKVEDELKDYRIGRWNVGEQKGLYKYDKNTYDREIEELLQAGAVEMMNMQGMVDVDEVEETGAEPEEEIYYGREADLTDLGENFLDGGYYEEDREYEDEY